LWQETRDPTCKTAVNWVTKSVRRLTRRKTLEWLEKKKIANTEVTPQAIWPIAKSLMERDGPKAPTAIRLSSRLYFSSIRESQCNRWLFGKPVHITWSATKTMNGVWRLEFLPKRLSVHLAHLFNHCLRISHFPMHWKVAKITILPKPGKDPIFSQNLWPISLLPTTSKIFEKAILKIVQRHIGERPAKCKPIWVPC
jgi:hypothetical protein